MLTRRPTGSSRGHSPDTPIAHVQALQVHRSELCRALLHTKTPTRTCQSYHPHRATPAISIVRSIYKRSLTRAVPLLIQRNSHVRYGYAVCTTRTRAAAALPKLSSSASHDSTCRCTGQSIALLGCVPCKTTCNRLTVWLSV